MPLQLSSVINQFIANREMAPQRNEAIKSPNFSQKVNN
jgi:hypothetical protein